MEHHVLVMHPGDKDLITAQITARNGKTILFVKIQRGADRLADNLAKASVPVGALHGGKSQAVRTRTLKLFKEQENAALVTTDVAARGIHVDGISLVPRRCTNRSQRLSAPLRSHSLCRRSWWSSSSCNNETTNIS